MHATLHLLMAVVALAGLQPAPVAETPKPPADAPAAQRPPVSVQRTFSFSRDGDQVRIEMDGDRIVKAERNGVALSDEEARALARELNLKVTELFPGGGGPRGDIPGGRVMIWGPDDAPWVGRLAPPDGGFRRRLDGPLDLDIDLGVMPEPPKSVIGVSLTRPSPDLAGYLGLSPDDFSVVLDVRPDSPAAKAGLKAFDVIVSINGQAAPEPSVRRVIGALEPGSQVKLTVRRAGQTSEHTIETVQPVGVIGRGGEAGQDDAREALRQAQRQQLRQLLDQDALRGLQGALKQEQEQLLRQNRELRERLDAIAVDPQTRLRWSSPRGNAERDEQLRAMLDQRLGAIELRLSELLRRLGGGDDPKPANPDQP